MKYLKNTIRMSILVFSLFFLNQNVMAQYCSAEANNNSPIYITNMQLNTINNSSSYSSYGYEDHTYLSTDLYQDNSYNLYVQFNYPNNINLFVWIDFNDDGDFYDSGEQVFSLYSYTGNNYNANIVIPSNATPGNHRMRIRNTYSTYTNYDQPCGTSVYSEVEDYTVNIVLSTGVRVTDIIHDDYNNFATTTDSVGVTIKNYYAFNIDTFAVSMSVIQPNGSIISKSETYYDTPLNGGAIITKYIKNVDFTQGGNYEITAITSTAYNPGVDNYALTETIDQSPFATPYSENIYTHKDWWNAGSSGYWDGWSMRTQLTTITEDSLITPAFKVSNDKLLFYYNANNSYLTNGDTVIVQIAEQGQAYTTVDTLYYGYYGYNIPIDLAAYDGKRIQVQFRIIKGSSTYSTTRLQISEVRVDPYYYDFRTTNISFPSVSNCGSYQYPIKVQIHNNGNRAQSNTDIIVRVYGTIDTVYTYTYTEEIEVGEYKWVDVGTIDATQSGNYEVIATVIPIIDSNDNNDVYSRNMYIDPATPLTLDISNNFTSYQWISSDINIYSNYLMSNYIPRGDTAYITTYFRIGELNDDAELHFQYNISSYNDNNNWGNSMGYNDSINIYISNDIYGTYTKIATIDSTLNNKIHYYQNFEGFDLSAYANQDIVIRFELINGPGGDTTKTLRLELDNIFVGKPTVDVAVSNLYTNVNTWCGNDSAVFTVDLANNSRFEAYDVPLILEFHTEDGSEYKHTQYIDTIFAWQSSLNITIDTAFSILDQGTYNAIAYTEAADDNNINNNSTSSQYTIYDQKELPYLESFNNNPYNEGWSMYNMTYNWSNVYSYNIYYNDYAELKSPKFGEITAGTYLAFKYLIQTAAGNYLRDGDTIKVFISSDCGTTWDEVYNLNHNNTVNTNQWQYVPNIDLTAYQGLSVFAKIEFRKKNSVGYNKIYIEDFQVVNSGDAGVQSLSFPNRDWNSNICGNDNEEAMIVVKNYGSGSLDNVPVELSFAVDQDTLFYNTTTGFIAAGSADTVYISGLDTDIPNQYRASATTELIDDLNIYNDASGVQTITTYSTLTMPYYYNCTNWSQYWDRFVSESNNNGWYNSNGRFYTPNMEEGDTAYIQSAKIGLIQANDELNIRFSVNSLDQNASIITNEFRTNDLMQVQISNDCGVSYTTIATFNSTNYSPSTNGDTLFTYDLANYIGDQVSLRLWVEKHSTIGMFEVMFDEIKLAPAPTPSVIINNLYFEDEICGKANEDVFIVITNNSNVDITNFNVNALLRSYNTGLYFDTLNYVFNGMLEGNETDTFNIGSFDSQNADTYSIESRVFINSEPFGNMSNSFTIYPMQANNYIASNNSYQDWKFDDYTYNNSWSINTNQLPLNRKSMAYSPKIEDIAPGSMLSLYYYKTSGTFGMDDSVNILVSNDCGATYSSIGSITNSNNLGGSFSDYADFSLAAYNGQNVQFAFEFVNGNNGTYTMRIQSVMIYTTDVEVLGIVTETEDFVLANYNPNNSYYNYADRYVTCGNTAKDLMVVVKNTGQTDVDTINVSISYTGKATGVITGTYIGTVQPNQSVAVSLNGTVDTQTPGLLDMTATVTVSNDAEVSNNTIGYSITTQTVYPVPYTAQSGTHFNEAYYWNYDDNANMNYSSWNGFNANNLDQGDTAYAISPKLEIDNNTSYLFFGYTVSNSLGEGHITSAEKAEVLISSDCGNTWSTLWTMDVNATDFGSSSMVMIDLSTYQNQDVRIKFQGIKGNSNGLFNVNYQYVRILDENPADITVSYNGMDHPSGATFCEGNNINLSTTSNLNLIYEWKFENTDTAFTIGSGSSVNHLMTIDNTGKIILEVKSSLYNNLLATTEYMINACEIPTIVLNYNNEERPSGSYFTEGNIVDYSFNSDASLNLNYNWSMNNTSMGTGATLNHTLSSIDNGDVTLELVNPATNYVVATASYSINTIANTSFTVETGSTTHQSGAVFVENETLTLSTIANSEITYSWKIKNSNTFYNIGSGSTINYQLDLADTGIIVLEAYSTVLNHIIDSAEFAMDICEQPEIVLTFNTEERPSGSTFANGNIVDFTFNSDASLNLNYNWSVNNSGTITSIGSGTALNHTLSTNDNGIITLELVNPISNFVVASTTYNINVVELPAIVLKVGSTTHASGATFCEGTEIHLNNAILDYLSSLSITFKWKINSVLIGTGATLDYTLLDADDGVITLEIISSLNKVIAMASYNLSVNPLPTQPIITGHSTVVSNIEFTDYLASGNHADQYLWSITNGGVISGQGTTGTVDWNYGYVGHTMISVTGYNTCGLGESSADFLVYVDFINPSGDDYAGDDSKDSKPVVNNDDFIISTFPNPNRGNFDLELPEEVINFKLEIRNSQGLLLEKMDVEGSSTKVYLGDRVPGVYIIKIITNGDIHTKTFVIY